MTILIDNKSGQPIYEQIFKQLKDQIINGSLKEGEPLPSIRNLAKDLRISVITSKRAYDELESAGFIYTVAGKGSFVAARNTELIREENLRQIEQHMDCIKQLAASCGISTQDLIEIFRFNLEDNI